MDALKKKFRNYWYYYKVHTIIGLLVLAAVVFLGVQDLGRTEPDYHIGVVTKLPCPQETLDRWQQRFVQAGIDRNGDGQVLVQLHPYPVDLKNPSQDSDTYQVIAQLDADLIGKLSGIFLLEDPQAFQDATNQTLSDTFQSVEDGLQLGIRKDAEDPYRQLLEALQ